MLTSHANAPLGGATPGNDDGMCNEATFTDLTSIEVGVDMSIYLTCAHAVRRISVETGEVTTVSGTWLT